MTQLIKLADAWKGHDAFVVTTTNVVMEKLQGFGPVHVVGECNYQHLLKVITVCFRCLRVLLKERPNVALSTGAAAGCMVCFISKMLGAKVVWLDSITNVKRLSLSGRMVRCIADLFLVQWPELAAKYKNVEYVDMVI